MNNLRQKSGLSAQLSVKILARLHSASQQSPVPHDRFCQVAVNYLSTHARKKAVFSQIFDWWGAVLVISAMMEGFVYGVAGDSTSRVDSQRKPPRRLVQTFTVCSTL